MTKPYFAFLLRLWQSGNQEGMEWRASLEDPFSHKVTGFSSLDSLCTYLRGLIDAKSAPGEEKLASLETQVTAGCKEDKNRES